MVILLEDAETPTNRNRPETSAVPEGKKTPTFPRTCNLDPAVIIILTWIISSNLIELCSFGGCLHTDL